MQQKTTKKIKVSRDSNIADLVFKYPEVAEIMLAFGLHCTNCFASHFDTIEQGAKIHEMMDEEIDEMIVEIEKVINEKQKL